MHVNCLEKDPAHTTSYILPTFLWACFSYAHVLDMPCLITILSATRKISLHHKCELYSYILFSQYYCHYN